MINQTCIVQMSGNYITADLYLRYDLRMEVGDYEMQTYI